MLSLAAFLLPVYPVPPYFPPLGFDDVFGFVLISDKLLGIVAMWTKK